MLHLGQFIEGVTVFVVVVEWDTYLHTVLWWFSLFLAIILLLSSMSLQKVSECRNVVTTSTHKRHHIPPPRPDDDEHAFTRRVQVHRPLHSLSFVYFSLPLLGRRINHRILLLKNLNNLILLSRTHTQPQTHRHKHNPKREELFLREHHSTILCLPQQQQESTSTIFVI